MKFILLLFLFVNLVAKEQNTLRVAYGKATMSDFSEIIVGNWQGHPNNLYATALDYGQLLQEGAYDLPLDFYARGSLSYFDEDNMRNDVYEATLYFKAFWNFDFLGNRVRFGFGEGISYTTAVLYTEWLEASQEHDTNSKFLNYLDVTLDFDVGRLVSYKPLYDTSIGWGLKHRSGIFGLINNVRRGGSNYNTFYIETKF